MSGGYPLKAPCRFGNDEVKHSVFRSLRLLSPPRVLLQRSAICPKFLIPLSNCPLLRFPVRAVRPSVRDSAIPNGAPVVGHWKVVQARRRRAVVYMRAHGLFTLQHRHPCPPGHLVNVTAMTWSLTVVAPQLNATSMKRRPHPNESGVARTHHKPAARIPEKKDKVKV